MVEGGNSNFTKALDKYAFAVALIVIIAIFVLHLLTPTGWADWLLYTIPVLVASPVIGRGRIIFLSCLSSILTIVGLFYSPVGLADEIALANRLLGIGLFWIIILLMLGRKSALDFIQESHSALEHKMIERTTDLETEIAEHRRADQALRRTDELFRIAADASRLMVYYVDASTRHGIAVHGLKELTGYSPDEINLNINWWTMQIHPEDRLANRQKYKEAIVSGQLMAIFWNTDCIISCVTTFMSGIWQNLSEGIMV